MKETKYFIRKDFIGFPIGIVVGEYDNGVRAKNSYHELPTKLSSKIKCFDTLEEILDYKYCKCGKPDCTFNAELYRLVSDLISCQNENNR